MELFEEKVTMSKILVADDNEANLYLLSSFLEENNFFVITAINGKQALEIVSHQKPDIILMDSIMPVLNGFDACRRIKRDDNTRQIPIIILTDKYSYEDYLKAMENNADDFLTKPINKALLLTRLKSLLRNKFLNDELEEYRSLLEKKVRERTRSLTLTQEVTIFSLAKLAESRDPETGFHLERIRKYSKLIAEEIRNYPKFKGYISDEYIYSIYLTSPLHDIGKVGIRDSILLKPGPLTSAEMEEMKKHSIIGGDTLKAADEKLKQRSLLSIGKHIAYFHHEKYDGTGYPYGTKGEDISLSARILAVADVYDALRSVRPYKPPWTHEESVKTITSELGRHFDPDIIKAFIAKSDDFNKINEKYKDLHPDDSDERYF